MLWEIKTAEKKNAFQRTYFDVPAGQPGAGKRFAMDEWYRWGWCTVRTDVEPKADGDDPHENPLELGDFELEDNNMDDGCSLSFDFPESENWTEEEIEYIERLWEQDGWLAFEENGIEAGDCDIHYYGPLEVTCIDATPEKPKAKGTWPF